LADGAKTLHVFANSTLAMFQLVAGLALLQYNHILSILLLAGAADNLLDVYAVVAGLRMPSWYSLVNTPLEFLSLLASMAGIAYALMYTTYFNVPMLMGLLLIFTLDALATSYEMAPARRAQGQADWVE